MCANIRNANQRDNSWDQLKKPDILEKCWEHTGKLYVGANVRKRTVKNAKVIPKIYYNRECCGSVARISRFKVEGRRFSPLDGSERDSKLEKRVWEKTWDVSTRAAKSNKWRTKKQTGGYVKKDRMGRRARICQRRKPVRYGPSTRIERDTRNFPILKADTPSDNRKDKRE